MGLHLRHVQSNAEDCYLSSYGRHVTNFPSPWLWWDYRQVLEKARTHHIHRKTTPLTPAIWCFCTAISYKVRFLHVFVASSPYCADRDSICTDAYTWTGSLITSLVRNKQGKQTNKQTEKSHKHKNMTSCQTVSQWHGKEVLINVVKCWKYWAKFCLVVLCTLINLGAAP